MDNDRASMGNTEISVRGKCRTCTLFNELFAYRELNAQELITIYLEGLTTLFIKVITL